RRRKAAVPREERDEAAEDRLRGAAVELLVRDRARQRLVGRAAARDHLTGSVPRDDVAHDGILREVRERVVEHLAAVTPVPAGQALSPEPVVAQRLVAAAAALALGEAGRALQRSGRATVAGADR